PPARPAGFARAGGPRARPYDSGTVRSRFSAMVVRGPAWRMIQGRNTQRAWQAALDVAELRVPRCAAAARREVQHGPERGDVRRTPRILAGVGGLARHLA